MTLGKNSYIALPPPDSNKIGTTKIFDTSTVSNSALQKEVMDYAQKLAGGAPVAPHPTAAGVWSVVTADGASINVRSISSSGVSRWMIDIQGNPSLNTLKSNVSKYEVKFK